jgi:agmatinase
MKSGSTRASGVTILVLAMLTPVAVSGEETMDTPEHVTGEQRYPFDTVDPREEDEPAIELPDSVAPKLGLLTPEEVEFLKSSDARAFAGSDEDTVEALNERTPEEVKVWVETMRQVVEHNRYREGRDSPSIPLNTGSPDFNAWRLEQPRTLDPVKAAHHLARQQVQTPLSAIDHLLSRPGIALLHSLNQVLNDDRR